MDIVETEWHRCWDQKIVKDLKNVKAFEHVCPCGCQQTKMSMIKAEAAQFFKGASRERGAQRINTLLSEITKNIRHSAAAISRTSCAKGHFCNPNKSIPGYDVITFNQIRRSILTCISEQNFMVGGMVLRRLQGWPMGGTASELATLIGLACDVKECYNSINKQ